MGEQLHDVYRTARMDRIAEHLRHIGTSGICEKCGRQVIYDGTSFEIALVFAKHRNRTLKILCEPCCNDDLNETGASAFIHLNNQAVNKEIDRITAERQ